MISIKGFFRRSIKENAPERYHCAENNNCLILSTSKISCRACRFRKCIQAGMSMDGLSFSSFIRNILPANF
jgi:glucocorticoid receptor